MATSDPTRVVSLEEMKLPRSQTSSVCLPWTVNLVRIALLAAVFLCGCTLHASTPKRSGPCANIPHADHPNVVIANGETEAVVFLPDAQSGYYRASRFDWSGLVACASFHGHTYFGEWFDDYDPLINDAVIGPAEEFRSEDGAIGYTAAPVGGLFLKPGVGVLRKTEETPYHFGADYPLVDGGSWTVHASRRSVRFEQRLQGPGGIAYIYTKTVELARGGSVLTLRHRLKSTGSSVLRTNVYDHDFFMLDGQPTGPGMRVRFAFEPRRDASFPGNAEPAIAATRFAGREILYTRQLGPGETFASYLTGYSASPSDYDITVENDRTGVGVEQTADAPLERLYLWSIRTTICPEAYIRLEIPPGKTRRWTIRYRLFGPPAADGSPATASPAASPAQLPS